jgi:hypothetical protein
MSHSSVHCVDLDILHGAQQAFNKYLPNGRRMRALWTHWSMCILYLQNPVFIEDANQWPETLQKLSRTQSTMYYLTLAHGSRIGVASCQLSALLSSPFS